MLLQQIVQSMRTKFQTWNSNKKTETWALRKVESKCLTTDFSQKLNCIIKVIVYCELISAASQ